MTVIASGGSDFSEGSSGSQHVVELVEVGPRDGFQSIEAFIPTDVKIDIVKRLHDSGLRRIEITSFVSERALPQMADASALVAAARELPDLDAQILVPNARYAQRALSADAVHFSCFISASERHNAANIKRARHESIEDYRDILSLVPSDGPVRFNVSTAFDCPFDGTVPEGDVYWLLDRALPLRSDVEVALCDTTGRADPVQVRKLFRAAASRYPDVRRWAFHGHDTYGLGAANALAAFDAGVRVFDAAVAGTGGCPFAPGATGNVATEDLVWMFDRMGVWNGVDNGRLVPLADRVAQLEGAQVGGRVRTAMVARARLCA